MEVEYYICTECRKSYYNDSDQNDPGVCSECYPKILGLDHPYDPYEYDLDPYEVVGFGD